MGVQKRIKIIRAVHYGVLFLFFVSLYLILKTESLGLYGATAILFMGGLQYAHKGHCPLTVEEHRALNKLGGHGKENFVESVFRHHLGIHVSRKLINTVLAMSFFLSGYIFLIYLIESLRAI